MLKKNKPVKVIIDTLKDLKTENAKKQGFTLVVTFSRVWCVHNWFANLNQLKINLKRCHLLIIDNTYFSELENQLTIKANIYKDVFKSLRLIKTYEPYGGMLVPKIRQRVTGSALPHIYNMHQTMLKYIKTRRFVLIEDDTLVPKNAIPRLLKILKENKDCGIATGIEPTQTVSSYHPTRLGVHYLKRKGWVLTERLSLPPYKKGLMEVDACGWYCCASYTDLWKKGFKDLKKNFNKIPHFAMDNMHTNNIQSMGYKILADFNVNCKHMSHTAHKIFFSEKKQSIPMLDIYLPLYDIYAPGHKVVWDDKLKEHWKKSIKKAIK